MNIAFLTSGHEPFDDRIFYHMARSLADHNNKVVIISSKVDLNGLEEGIMLNCFAGDMLTKKGKIRTFKERLTVFNPDTIICSEPLPLLAAKHYKNEMHEKIRIIYDITEWYPSKKNLAPHNYLLRPAFFIKLLLFNFYAARNADSFIFGEWYKSRAYRFLFPGKPFIFSSYYPDLKYVPYCEPAMLQSKLRLSYSGKISIEKGFGNFISVINTLIKLNREIKIELKIIGWYGNDNDKYECESLLKSISPNIPVKIFEKQNFKSFIELIKDTDIFLDLRLNDFENNHCLPIKLFYYAALGRPVIHTDLKAIRKEVDAEIFGFLVKPDDYEAIGRIILNYFVDVDLYLNHCLNARMLAETKYNWKENEPQFIKFLTL